MTNLHVRVLCRQRSHIWISIRPPPYPRHTII